MYVSGARSSVATMGWTSPSTAPRPSRPSRPMISPVVVTASMSAKGPASGAVPCASTAASSRKLV